MALSGAALACLAGCGGEDGTLDPLSYLSQYGAPAAIDPAVFAWGILTPSNIATLTANLLNTQRYQNTQTQNWTAYFDVNPPVSGLNSDPLRTSGAAFAHAAGYTGAGQTIAISDGGYQSGFAEFAGKSVTVVNNTSVFDASDPLANRRHGTIVASAAAGNAADSVGTAPDASLIFGTFETEQALIDVGVAATNAGAVVWNNSWGFEPFTPVNEAGFNETFATVSGQTYFSTLQTYAANGVVVFAASNNETLLHSQLMEALPAIRPGLEAGWISAVNGVPTMSGGDVSAVQLISSACYESARWCLIADGTWQVPDVTLQFDAGDNLAIGTSFAAPQISGAMAILAQAFPALTPHELRVRLLASADDGFFAPDASVELATGFSKGYSVIYGHGFLDIEAALNPIGPTAMAMADGSRMAVSAPVLVAGTAIGDAVARALTGTDVAVQDALNTAFAMPADALVTTVAPTAQSRVLMAEAVRGRTAPQPLAAPFAGYRGQTLALQAPDNGLRAAILLPPSGESSAGISLSQTVVAGPMRVDLGLTVARDGGGTLALGGAGGQAAMAASVSLGVMQEVGRAGFMSLSGEVGMADLGKDGAIAQGGHAAFNRVAFEAGQANVLTRGDRVSFGIGMPLAITSGSTTIRVPVIRAAGITTEALNVDLAPTDRQIDLTLRYSAPISAQMDMTFLIAHSENFGNRAGVRDTGAALLFAMRF